MTAASTTNYSDFGRSTRKLRKALWNRKAENNSVRIYVTGWKLISLEIFLLIKKLRFVDCQHVVTVQWFPISGSRKSRIEILVFEIFILFCPLFLSPSFRSILVLSLFRPRHSRLSFNKTHLCRVCFVCFKLLGRHAVNYILHWDRFVYRPPVGK